MKIPSKEKIHKSVMESMDIFTPCDLCESEVNSIFARCLATKPSKDNVFAQLSDIRTLDGSKADKTYFDADQLKANRRNILYLFGQLMTAHVNVLPNMKIAQYLIKYDASLWTKVKEDVPLLESPICKLLYLGNGLRINTGMEKDENGTIYILLAKEIKPTLSPNDPDFPAWWAEHRSEWEDQPE